MDQGSITNLVFYLQTVQIDTTGDALKTKVMQFTGSLFLAILGLLALPHLIRRRLLGLLSFFVLGGLVGIFVFKPDWVEAIGTAIFSLFVKG